MTTTETETPEGGTEGATPGGPDEPTAPEAPPRPGFWQRPYVDRYFTPIALPLLIVAGLVLFVINISRIFLAGHGEVPVIIGTIITVSIIGGAAILSAAPNLRSSSLALVTAGFVVVVMMGGWLSLGSSAPEGEGGAALAREGPADAQLDFTTEGLRFVPDTVDAPTGVVGIAMTSNSGAHTFVFEDPATLFPGLDTPGTGSEDAARAFFADAGEYVFYCTIPGHREAGMEGVLTADGEPKVLETELARLEAEGEGANQTG
jgi:plastocyanin